MNTIPADELLLRGVMKRLRSPVRQYGIPKKQSPYLRQRAFTVFFDIDEYDIPKLLVPMNTKRAGLIVGACCQNGSPVVNAISMSYGYPVSYKDPIAPEFEIQGIPIGLTGLSIQNGTTLFSGSTGSGVVGIDDVYVWVQNLGPIPPFTIIAYEGTIQPN